MSKSSDELASIAQALGPVIQSNARVTVRTLLEAQKALGEEPDVLEAYSLTTVHAVLQDSGSVKSLIQDGMSQATAYRRRARLQQLLAAADDDAQDRAAMDVFGATEVLLARQLADSLNDQRG